jgi:glycosyltransferase involved in cell wall biosynthesis
MLANLLSTLAKEPEITSLHAVLAHPLDYEVLTDIIKPNAKLKLSCSINEAAHISSNFGQKCLEECDLVYFNWPHVLPNMMNLERVNKPSVCTFQDTTVWDFGLYHYDALNHSWIETQKFLKNIDQIVVASNYIKERLALMLDTEETNHINIVKHYYVSKEILKAKNKPSLPLPPRYIVCPTNIESHKNIVNLLLAWCQFKTRTELPLVFFGSGTDQLAYQVPEWSPGIPQITSLVYRKGLKPHRDFFPLGLIRDEEVIPIIKNAEALIMPTLAEGGGSYPVEEAIALKIPVLCSSIPPIVEQLEGREVKSVLFFDPENPVDILGALNYFVEHYEPIKAIASAHEYTYTDSWDQAAKNYLTIFKKALKSKPKEIKTATAFPAAENQANNKEKRLELYCNNESDMPAILNQIFQNVIPKTKNMVN